MMLSWIITEFLADLALYVLLLWLRNCSCMLLQYVHVMNRLCSDVHLTGDMLAIVDVRLTSFNVTHASAGMLK